MILLSTIGGILCGAHVALFLQHGFAPWIIFNFGIGLFCVWGAILIGAERHQAEEENENNLQSPH
jgi:uncharacterized membrane protein